MKKTMLFAAMAALLTVASCQKEDVSSQNSAKDPVFTATIENSATKTSVDAANNKVDWVMNDEITVTDNASVSVKYIVSAIDGSGKATFTKKSGETKTLGAGPYTAVYGTAPSASQTYSTSAPSLPMSGASGASDTNLKFTVTCGLLEITLTQADESIKSISVSDNASTPNTYTLNCGDGVSIEDGAKFYIAVPAGTYTTFQFTNGTDVVRGRIGLSIAVVENHIKPVSSNFAPKYSAGKTDLDYGIKIGSTWWAPVNCGYDTSHPMGLLYQWGRQYGQAYETGTITPEPMVKDDDTEENKGKFGQSSGETHYNWFPGDVDNTLWNGDTKGIKDPCPEGWRVPSSDELLSLVVEEEVSHSVIEVGGQKGCYFDGTTSPKSGVFLPQAGVRPNADGVADLRNNCGYYWSSSVNGNDAIALRIEDGYVDFGKSTSRAIGYSVRCVKE